MLRSDVRYNSEVMSWLSLKKGGSGLHVAYADTSTSNLRGYDAKVRIRPTVEISLDLNRNLRTKNKSENGYVDARELADGEIDQLELVQICDERVIDRLSQAVEMADNPASEWGLTIELEGQHKFCVRPDPDRSDSVFLRVIRP
jgi:hypothetical protein